MARSYDLGMISNNNAFRTDTCNGTLRMRGKVSGMWQKEHSAFFLCLQTYLPWKQGNSQKNKNEKDHINNWIQW